jgi:catechol 2,3-dioxygenase-like lactoylglutathione lyase family enzyme
VVSQRQNKEFEIRGVNHLALVCKDMERTVDFYCNVLGMPLVKTLDLPNGMGQHFFFDIGNGDTLAFFWFPDAPPAAPGIAGPRRHGGGVGLESAHGSMNHVAFDVPPDEIESYRERLREKGIETTEVINHDDSPAQASLELTESTWVRSIYFFDPDGILLEFAAWTRELVPDDLRHSPAREEDRQRYLVARAEGPEPPPMRLSRRTGNPARDR